MQLRELSIRSVPFIRLGESLTDRKKNLRKAGLIQDFLDMVPSFKRLQSSALVCKHSSRPDGLHLEFCILESPQISLPQLGPLCPKGVPIDDFQFRSDLKMLQEDLSKLPAHILESLSSDRDLLDILDCGEYGAQLRVIRKSVRLKSNLYSLIQPELTGVDSGSPSHIISLGHEIHIDAQVHDFKKSIVRLKNFVFSSEVPHEIQNAAFGNYIDARRPTMRDDGATNSLLLNALDDSEILRFKADAAFRWRDGKPTFFEILSVKRKLDLVLS